MAFFLQTGSSSSEEGEKLTISFAESVVESDSQEDEFGNQGDESWFSSDSFTTTSLETPTSEESVTSLLANLEVMKEKENMFGYEPVWRTMSMSDGPKMDALDYFWSHSIFQLFTFLMTHLLANTPPEPVQFLLSLVDRCIKYRDEDAEPPLVFEDSHVCSVYTALDPMDDGSITYGQYLAGMNTLGLTQINLMPNELSPEQRDVAKDVFIKEAKLALLRQLDVLLNKPPRPSSTEEELSKSDTPGETLLTTSGAESESYVAESLKKVQVEDKRTQSKPKTGPLDKTSTITTMQFVVPKSPTSTSIQPSSENDSLKTKS